MDVPGPKLPADLPAYLRTHVAPEVPPELRAAFLAATEGTIRTMQNKQLTSKPLHQPGGAGRGAAGMRRRPPGAGARGKGVPDGRTPGGARSPPLKQTPAA